MKKDCCLWPWFREVYHPSQNDDATRQGPIGFSMVSHAREKRHEKHALSCLGLGEFDHPYHAVAQARPRRSHKIGRGVKPTKSARAKTIAASI